MDTQSGLQLPAWLSGLNLGSLDSLSGAPDQGMTGPAATAMGMGGGLGLSDLSALLAAQNEQGGGLMPGQQSDLFSPIGGTVGQGINSFAPTQQYLTAGAMGQPQAGTRGYQAGQTTEGGIDPLQIIQLALRAGNPFAQMLGQQQGGAPGAAPEQQSGYGSYRAGEQQDYTGGNSTPFSQYASTLGINTPALAASLGITPQEYESLLGASAPMQIELAQQSGINPDAIMNIIKAQSMGMPEQMGWLPNAGETEALRTGQEAPLPGVGGYGSGGGGPQSDIFGGSLLGAQGLANIAGGIRGGGEAGTREALGGSAQTLSGFSKLFPEEAASLSEALGLGGQGFGMASGGLGELASLLGLATSIQSGDPVGSLSNAAGVYSGAVPLANAAFGTQLPTLTGAASEALGLAPGVLGAAVALYGLPIMAAMFGLPFSEGTNDPFQETKSIRGAFGQAYPQYQQGQTAAQGLRGLEGLSPEDQIGRLQQVMAQGDISRAANPAVSEFISTQGGRKSGREGSFMGFGGNTPSPHVGALDVSGIERTSGQNQLGGVLSALAARDALLQRGIDVGPYWDINQTLGLLSPYAGVYRPGREAGAQGYEYDPSLEARGWQEETLGQFTPEERQAMSGGSLAAIESAFGRVNPQFAQSAMGQLLSQWGNAGGQQPIQQQQQPSPFQTMQAGTPQGGPGYGGYDEQTISLMRSLGLL